MSIEVMKQALEAMERIKSYGNIFMYRKTERNPYDQAVEAITALRQAIAEAEKQEPVAWIVDGKIKVRLDMAGKLYYSETNVYATPVHAIDISAKRVDETAKRKHEWVGLTDEEILAELPVTTSRPATSFARAIEAKLKEKNT